MLWGASSVEAGSDGGRPVGAEAGQVTQEAKDRGIGVDYGQLTADRYEEVDMDTSIVDLPHMVKTDTVKVMRYGSQIKGRLILSNRESGANSISVDVSGLPREQQIALMKQQCTAIAKACPITVYGKPGERAPATRRGSCF